MMGAQTTEERPKRRSSLLVGLLVLHILLTVVVASVIGMYGVYLFQKNADQVTRNRVDMVTCVLSNYMQSEITKDQCTSMVVAQDPYVQSVMDALEERTEISLYLFQEDGTCLVHSEKSGVHRDVIQLPEKVLNILKEQGSYTAGVTLSTPLNPEETRPVSCDAYVFQVQELSGAESSYILFANTYARTVDDYTYLMLLIALIVVAVSVALYFLFQRFLLRHRNAPVEEIVSAVQQYAKGDFSAELDPHKYPQTMYAETAAALNQLAYNCRESENQRAEFVSNVSHELRTPMTIISGYVDGILDGTVPKTRRMEYLAIVSQEMQRLKILVSSMLNLTKLDNGTIQLKKDYFSIRDMVFRTILMFEARLEKKQVAVEGMDGNERVHVYGDYDLIGQVVYNFIENAVKFVNTSGTISFRFENTPDSVIFAVRNTGPGIKKEELPKIFNRFFKSDFSRSEDKTGLGLGLDISRRILRLHGAVVRVSSEENVFTEFEITFPNKPQTATQPPQPQNPEEPASGRESTEPPAAHS